jgi:hypothetical protein
VSAARSTPWLAGAVALGFAWIGLFEPRLPTTPELQQLDARLIGARGAEVRRIKISRDAWTYATLERVDEGSFRTVDPTDRVVPASASRRFLSAVEFCTVHHQLDGDRARPHDLGLDRPRLTLALQLAEPPEVVLTFGKDGPGGVYTTVAGRDGVSVVDPSLLLAAEALLDDILIVPEGEDRDRTEEER